MSRTEVLSGIYDFIEPFGNQYPWQILDGYESEPGRGHDPLVTPHHYAPKYVPKEMIPRTADGQPLPGGYYLSEVIKISDGRYVRSESWTIRLGAVGLLNEPGEVLANDAQWPTYAQIGSSDPTSATGEMAFPAPERPLGMFFLPDREKLPPENPDALFIPKAELIMNSAGVTFRSDKELASQLPDMRAPDEALLRLYQGLTAYAQNFRDNRVFWRFIQEKSPL